MSKECLKSRSIESYLGGQKDAGVNPRFEISDVALSPLGQICWVSFASCG